MSGLGLGCSGMWAALPRLKRHSVAMGPLQLASTRASWLQHSARTWVGLELLGLGGVELEGRLGRRLGKG